MVAFGNNGCDHENHHVGDWDGASRWVLSRPQKFPQEDHHDGIGHNRDESVQKNVCPMSKDGIKLGYILAGRTFFLPLVQNLTDEKRSCFTAIWVFGIHFILKLQYMHRGTVDRLL